MYGLIILLAAFISLNIGERLVKKKGLSVNLYWKLCFLAIIGGLIGARIYHVISSFPYYSINPLEIFQVWKGGVGIYGAVIGGLIGVFLGLRGLQRKDLPDYLDTFAVILPLAQAIGRWGNYFNKEVFGLPTSLPWGIYIPWELRPEGYLYYTHFHPLFLYESILDLLIFYLLYRLSSANKLKSGVIFLGYLLGYGIIRFLLEFLRINPWKVLGIPTAQVVSLVFIVTAGIFLFKVYLKRSKISS